MDISPLIKIVVSSELRWSKYLYLPQAYFMFQIFIFIVYNSYFRLDREHLANYDLTAYAEDRGTPTQRTAVRILVTVTDVDDNPPTFEKDVLVFNVSEDSRVGSVVAKLVATDLDEGGQSDVMYELTSIESMELWDLDPQTGELRPTFQLDYEKQPSYVLIVYAYSGLLVSEVKLL